MANIKDDPKVQDLITKARDKAAKATRKAIVNAMKQEGTAAVDGAKAAESSKDVIKALKDLNGKLLETAKMAEPEVE